MARSLTASAGGERPATPLSRPELDREIWIMAWPVMLSLLLVNFVDIVDVANIGRLGRESIAAFGYAAQFQHLVQTLLQSVGIGTVALMARALGAGDKARARRYLAGSLVLAQGVAWAMFAGVAFAPGWLLGFFNAEPEVVDLAIPYLRVSVLSTTLFALSFTLESAFRAHKLTRAPLIIAIVMGGVKIVLNAWLIFGGLGVEPLGLLGAGYATLGAYATATLLYIGTAYRGGRQDGAVLSVGLSDFRRLAGTVREVSRVAGPAMGERLLMSLALMTYFRLLAPYGTGAIAAYAIGVRLLSYSWIPGLGFSTAASTFVGQALGANAPEEARRAGVRAVLMALGFMAVTGIACAGFRETLARLFTSDEGIIANLLPFMLMLAIAQPFMGAHFTLSGILRGASDTVTPLIGALVGAWFFRVTLAYLAASVLRLDVEFVWAALIADHIVRSAINFRAFRRGRWMLRTGHT